MKWIWLLLAWLCWVPQPVQAAAGAQYTVRPQLPANQRTANAGYWDLIVRPGQTQDLRLTLTNRSQQVRRLAVSVTTAWSQASGVVGYQPGGPRDDSAQYRLSALAPRPQTVTLPPAGHQQLSLPLKIPAHGFAGVLLGAVYVEDLAHAATARGTALKNRFATVVGVQLQTSVGAINRVTPHLRLQRVAAGIQAGRPAVLATVQNDTPRYWGKMRWRATVYTRRLHRVVLRRDASDYAMAPNSHLAFALAGKQALTPGAYRLDLKITGPHGRWHFTRPFTIEAAQAQRINRKLGLRPRRSWWWLLGVILVLIGAWLSWWHKQSKKKAKE